MESLGIVFGSWVVFGVQGFGFLVLGGFWGV